jgi:molybdopterin-guanine dinucleotide biosynthesis protein A
MNRSRQQTRHRTFGWYAGDPVAHNRTVRIAKARRRQAKAFRAFRARVMTSGAPLAALATALTDFGNASKVIAAAVNLGMSSEEASDQVTHLRRTTTMSWPRIEATVTRNALHNAFYQSGPDHE